MKISFFEEFPSKENLDKLKLLSFKTNLYLAAPSLREFKVLSKKIKKNYKNINTLIYWPTLSFDEGYWLSPFSHPKALQRVIHELYQEERSLSVLWDAELPTLKKMLYLKNLFYFLENKKLITNFLTKTKHKIHCAEYGYDTAFLEQVYQLLALSFERKKIPHKKILMLYTSFVSSENIEDYLLRHIHFNQEEDKKIAVGLGTIAKGIVGNEPILSSKRLAHDLLVLQSENVKEVVIYRLGGLNKENLGVLQKFV